MIVSDCLSRHMRGVVPQKYYYRAREIILAGRIEVDVTGEVSLQLPYTARSRHMTTHQRAPQIIH